MVALGFGCLLSGPLGYLSEKRVASFFLLIVLRRFVLRTLFRCAFLVGFGLGLFLFPSLVFVGVRCGLVASLLFVTRLFIPSLEAVAAVSASSIVERQRIQCIGFSGDTVRSAREQFQILADNCFCVGSHSFVLSFHVVYYCLGAVSHDFDRQNASRNQHSILSSDIPAWRFRLVLSGGVVPEEA